MKPLKAVPPLAASEPAQFTLAEAIAVQALSQASADDEQQRIAWKWIIESACGLPVWAYRENARETDVALGRQFVGQQMVGLALINISKLKQREVRNG